MQKFNETENNIKFTVDGRNSKFIFKINGKVVKIIQEPWYRRLYNYIKTSV